MKTLLSVILTAGTAYYVTSRVAITGPSDWGAVPPSAPHRNDYAISASNSPLAGVTVSGDPQFTIDGSACVGARSCVAPASLLANVGGDYVASIVGTSSSRLRVHGMLDHAFHLRSCGGCQLHAFRRRQRRRHGHLHPDVDGRV